MAGWPVTGRRRGVLSITAAAWTVGFQRWRSGDIKRTQNVSEYALVLALCIVLKSANVFGKITGKKVDCPRRCADLGTVLLKDEELARDREYDKKQLSGLYCYYRQNPAVDTQKFVFVIRCLWLLRLTKLNNALPPSQRIALNCWSQQT